MPSVFLFLLGPAIVDMNDFFDNTAGTLTQGRDDAVQSLDRQPVAVSGRKLIDRCPAIAEPSNSNV